MTSTTKHVLLKGDIVTYIGTKEEAQNSEPGLQWMEVAIDMPVEVGYRYYSKTKSFVRARGSLDYEKKRLLGEVNYAYDLMSKKILSSFPEEEVKTFPFQVSELSVYNGYKAGDEGADPIMLKAIAYQRGIPLDILVERTQELATHLKHTLGTMVGRRQWLEQEILEALDFHRLDIIEMEVENFKKGVFRK